MQQIVANLAKKDIYTLVDFHQDIANRYFCGEGFPDWSVDPTDPSIHRFPFPIVDTPYAVNSTTGYPVRACAFVRVRLFSLCFTTVAG